MNFLFKICLMLDRSLTLYILSVISWFGLARYTLNLLTTKFFNYVSFLYSRSFSLKIFPLENRRWIYWILVFSNMFLGILMEAPLWDVSNDWMQTHTKAFINIRGLLFWASIRRIFVYFKCALLKFQTLFCPSTWWNEILNVNWTYLINSLSFFLGYLSSSSSYLMKISSCFFYISQLMPKYMYCQSHLPLSDSEFHTLIYI